MLSFAILSLLALSSPLSALADGVLTINTPANVVQCQNTLLTYSGGTGPYIISVLPGQSMQGAYETLFTQPASSTSVTWLCDIGAGTLLTLGIKDSTGAVQYSAVVTIGASPTGDESCLGQNAVAQASILLTASSNTLGTSATGASSSSSASATSSVSTTNAASSASASTTASSTQKSGALNSFGQSSYMTAGSSFGVTSLLVALAFAL